jgi:hypothetical protein
LTLHALQQARHRVIHAAFPFHQDFNPTIKLFSNSVNPVIFKGHPFPIANGSCPTPPWYAARFSKEAFVLPYFFLLAPFVSASSLFVLYTWSTLPSKLPNPERRPCQTCWWRVLPLLAVHSSSFPLCFCCVLLFLLRYFLLVLQRYRQSRAAACKSAIKITTARGSWRPEGYVIC